MLNKLEPITLSLDHGTILLEPLRRGHAADLIATCGDEQVWTYAVEWPRTVAEMTNFIERAVAAERAGTELPFAIIDVQTGRAIGSTRYLEIITAHNCLEIGWTWIGLPWQRTGCNTQCKYMLFRHAFEVLGASRVQLKADARNTQSRAAIERIGGVYEGTLRKHRVLASGYVRDSAYYSVIREEWPAVKTRIEARLRSHSSSTQPSGH